MQETTKQPLRRNCAAPSRFSAANLSDVAFESAERYRKPLAGCRERIRTLPRVRSAEVPGGDEDALLAHLGTLELADMGDAVVELVGDFTFPVCGELVVLEVHLWNLASPVQVVPPLGWCSGG